MGAINIQSDEDPVTRSSATNFTVLRLKRDLFRRSSLGGIFTNRSATPTGAGAAQSYGVDGAFAFFDNLFFNTYWAQTRTDDGSVNDTSYRTQLDYAGDRYGVQIERLVVGERFNPEVGFLRRSDLRKSFGQLRFSPRPRWLPSVRKFSWLGSLSYIENSAGHLETREREGEFAIEFQNSDRFSAGYTNTYEFLPQPFPIASGVTLPVGGYDFDTVRTGFNFGQQRRFSANLSAEHGSF
jgi:hypothetical protein